MGADGPHNVGDGLLGIEQHADVLLLAGDLTRHGTVDEARRLADRLGDVRIPVVAVLGNHDHHSGLAHEVTRVLVDASIAVLDRQCAIIDLEDHRVGIAGAKGFGGRFEGATVAPFGEPEMKAFMAHAHTEAEGLRGAFASPFPTRSSENDSSCIRSSAVSCWPKSSTAHTPISPSTATRMADRNMAGRPLG